MEVIPEPPGLPYSLRQHKLSISIIWTLLAIDITVLPITLYFSLAFATHLKSAYIFAITTSVFGLISGIEWAFRSWHLWRWPRVRPLHDASSPDILDQERTGSEAEEGNELKDDEKKNRWHFDFFHWTYTTGYAVALVCSRDPVTFVILQALDLKFQAADAEIRSNLSLARHRTSPLYGYARCLRPRSFSYSASSFPSSPSPMLCTYVIRFGYHLNPRVPELDLQRIGSWRTLLQSTQVLEETGDCKWHEDGKQARSFADCYDNLVGSGELQLSWWEWDASPPCFTPRLINMSHTASVCLLYSSAVPAAGSALCYC